MSTFDAVISRSARTFPQSLSSGDRDQFFRVLDSLLSDPHPDGASKVPLNYYPYNPGTVGYTGGQFWITYTFLNGATIGITGAQWSPNSPRRRGELFEI